MDIDVLCTCFVVGSAEPRRCTWSIKDQNRIGLVNASGVLIHHVVNGALIYPVAFIFDERASGMVNRWCEAAINQRTQSVPA
jgi:hypothetical protein